MIIAYNFVSTDIEINRLNNALKAQVNGRKLVYEQVEHHEEVKDYSWTSFRTTIFEQVVQAVTSVNMPLCIMCHANSEVRCMSCGCLCADCDRVIHHKSALLHDRTDSNGDYLDATMFICDTEKQRLGKWFPPVTRGEGCLCGGGTFESIDGCTPLSVITMRGRFNISAGVLKCAACGAHRKPGPLSYIPIGFWPSGVQRLTTLISEEVLRHCSLLLKQSPRTSISAFCRLLTDISRHRAGITTIRSDMFAQVLREYNYCQDGLSRYLEPCCLECPSCTRNQHAAHIDGNFKLYRLKGNSSNDRPSYYGDSFIAADEDVSKLVELVRGSDKRTDKNCGERFWKAGQNVLGSSRRNVDETGLSIVSCRHVVAQKASNMVRGELFAYPFFHQIGVCAANKTRYICTDVACQYWPWSLQHQKMQPKDYSPKPFLSVMHAKAHIFNCQVTWGGRWQVGSGLTTGESTELVNSYLSRFGLRTKYMTKAGRQESLTEAAVFWNRQKIRGLAKYLSAQYRKALRIQNSSLKDVLHTDEELASWKNLLERLACTSTQDQLPLEHQMELVYASMQRKRASMTTLADTCKERSRIRAGIRREEAKLKKLIGTYNERNGSLLTMECFDSEGVPWMNKLVPEGHTLPKIRQAVEQHLLVQRSTEELNIVRQEMMNYLNFYQQQLSGCTTETDAVGRSVTQYNLSGTSVASVEMAVVRLHRKKLEFIEHQLAEGLFLFQEALQDKPLRVNTDDDTVSGSDPDSGDEAESDVNEDSTDA